MKQAKLYIVVALGCFLAAGSVGAQIVNIEDKRQVRDTTGWFGQADLRANLTRNLSRVFSGGASLRTDHVGPRADYLFLAGYNLLRVSGNNFVHDGFVHLRANRRLAPRLVWEAFAQTQYDKRLRLDLRQLLGTGPRLRFTPSGDSPVYLGLLYMFEYDEFAERTFIYRDHRLSAYLSFQIKLGENGSLSNTSYYQPLLFDFALARISSATTLALNITDRLRFTSSFSLLQDPRIERDLPDVPAFSYGWQNGIRYTW